MRSCSMLKLVIANCPFRNWFEVLEFHAFSNALFCLGAPIVPANCGPTKLTVPFCNAVLQ